MSSKRRLGRGLDTLLGQVPSDAGAQPRPSALLELSVESIRPNPQQPRETFDAAALAELEQSIREIGVLVPLIVRARQSESGEPTYELIAGERRLRAATAAGLTTVPFSFAR